jgi:hypothetical protein
VLSEARLNVRCQPGIIPILMDRAQKDVDVVLIAHAADDASRAPRRFNPVCQAQFEAGIDEFARRATLWNVKLLKICSLRETRERKWRSQPKLSSSGMVRLRAVAIQSASADSLREK